MNKIPNSKISPSEKIETLRHSLAHILAAAVQELYPGAKFGIGPVIENGFYYDFETIRKIIPNQGLDKILILAILKIVNPTAFSAFASGRQFFIL